MMNYDDIWLIIQIEIGMEMMRDTMTDNALDSSGKAWQQYQICFVQ